MSIRINGKKYRNGTIVRANPIEEATGTLEKIGIGSDVYEIQGSGGGGSAKIDLLYDSGDYNTPAEKGVDIDLAHNLSDYDVGYIVYSYPPDRTDPALYNTSYQSFLVDDVLGYPAGKKCVLIAGYGTRHRFIDFTDTTFNIRTSGSDFEVYKIYGVKYGSGCGSGSGYSETVLWSDSTGVNADPTDPQTITLSDNLSNYDFIYVDTTPDKQYDVINHNNMIVPVSSIDTTGTNSIALNCLGQDIDYIPILFYDDDTHLILSAYNASGEFPVTYWKIVGIKIDGGGTEVEANPQGTPTDTLETISIDGTVYDISGSGGETVYDVNDYYLQDGQISDGGNRQFLTAYYDKSLVSGKNYLINFKNSVDGSVVGTSLFKYTSDFTTTMTGGGSIGTITMIITSTSITSNNYSGSWQNIYVDVYREISSAEFYHPVIYSTEEREIGVWTDNKPLYEKTVFYNNAMTYRTWVRVVDETDINIVEHEGLIYLNGDPYCELDYYRGSDSSEYVCSGIANKSVIQIFQSFSNFTVTCRVTYRYTKDSDVAGSGSYNTLGVPTVHYTTDEQVIGTWVDGKPLYRKIYTNLNVTPAYNYWTNIMDIPINADKYIGSDIILTEGANGNIDLTHSGLEITFSESENKVKCEYNQNTNVRPINILSLLYTKTTD